MSSRFSYASGQQASGNSSRPSINGRSWRAPPPPEPEDGDVIRPAELDRFYPETQRVIGGGRDACAGRTVFKRSGNCTLDDPLILWHVQNNRSGLGPYVSVLEDAVRRAAKFADMKVVSIRATAHNTMSERQKDGVRVTVLTNSGMPLQATKVSDWHLTVSMGCDPRLLQIQGHIFLKAPSHPTEPYHFMDQPKTDAYLAGRRQYPGGSKDPQEKTSWEFWLYKGVKVTRL
ncbi:hypothetical protein QBC47DRAFT_364436 [Echria macrotheca]|uniref:Uncharacterized protein n=1 Tax=Echria macrotheca TaxID=438768 RepID=A0AAJ0B498_9PEZI|nr:hypothetical protein QBC47DRAFT_364436 [Echria macrotheca]